MYSYGTVTHHYKQRYGPAGRWRIGYSVLIKISGMDSPSADMTIRSRCTTAVQYPSRQHGVLFAAPQI